MMPSESEMSDYFQRLLEVLKCAYPDVPDNNERLHLTYFLYNDTDLTSREVAYIVGQLVGQNYLDLMGDVNQAISLSTPPSKDKLLGLKEELTNCGYGDWATESTKKSEG